MSLMASGFLLLLPSYHVSLTLTLCVTLTLSYRVTLPRVI
jgi:hypothetical protein